MRGSTPKGDVSNQYADVAELADALDLGSSAYGVGVRLPSSAPIEKNSLLIIKSSFLLVVA
jgi:hypothetical protein